MRTDSLVPPRGTAADFVERLVAFCSRADPSFASRIRAAAREDLEHYLTLSCPTRLVGNRPMPSLWLNYANSFGGSDGDLFTDFKLRTDVRYLVSLYEEELRFRSSQIDYSLPMVGNFYVVGSPLSLDLRKAPEDDAPVVHTDADEPRPMYSTSWERLSFRAALRYCATRTVPFRAFCSASANDVKRMSGSDDLPIIERLALAAGRLGMESVWLCEQNYFSARSPQGIVEVNVDESGGFLLRAYSESPAEADALRKGLGMDFGASIPR